jgi:flagellin-like protein
MKKRGLSNIIAVLLMVMITIVAIAIVWFVLRGIIQKNTEEIRLSKFTIDLDIETLKITELTLTTRIKRNPGEGDLKGINFLVFDGANTHVFEKLDIELNPLERKTFILDYTGEITKLSIAPIFESETGRLIIGNIADVYYVTGFNLNCTPDCETRQCGPVPNGCGLNCGVCLPSEPLCENGACVNSPCDNSCACGATTCDGAICLNDCGNPCPGEILDDCGTLDCGTSPNGCGECGICEPPETYHCDAGICVVTCVEDCGERECGPVPNECGDSCGSCDIPGGYWCNLTIGMCTNGICEEECGTRVCGPGPICGENCGSCDDLLNEWCSEDGQCLSERFVNNGTVFSVWPIGVGIYFDSEDLNKSGVDFSQYYVRFPGSPETRCLQIREFLIPVIPEIYNVSHVRFVTSYTDAQPNDAYEVWHTYEGCTNAQS